MISSQENILNQALRILEALTSVTRGDHFFRQPLHQIGWDADAITNATSNSALPSPYDSLKEQIEIIADKILELRDDLDPPPDTFEAAQSVYEKILELIRLIRTVTDTAVLDEFKSGLDSSAAWNNLGTDLVSLVVTQFFEVYYPRFYHLTRLLTITVSPEDFDPSEISVVRHTNSNRPVRRAGVWWPHFKPLRGLELISQPRQFLTQTYLTTDGELTLDHSSNRLFQHLTGLANVLGLRARYGIRTWMEPAFGAQVETAKHTFTLFLQEDPLIALSINLSPLAQGNMGLVIVPTGFPAPVQDLEDWTLNIDLVNSGPEVTSFALGPEGPTILPEGASPELSFELRSKTGMQIGALDGTHFRADTLFFSGYAKVNGDNQEYGFKARLEGYDLGLMSLTTTDDILREAHSLVIVARVSDQLHIRIFDVSGDVVVDKTENQLLEGDALIALKQLNPLPVPSDLSVTERQQIIENAKACAGYTDHKNGAIKLEDLLTLSWTSLGLVYSSAEPDQVSIQTEGLKLKVGADSEFDLSGLNIKKFDFIPSTKKLTIQFDKMEIMVLDAVIVSWDKLELNWDLNASKPLSLNPSNLKIQIKGDKQPRINFGSLKSGKIEYFPAKDEQPSCLIIPIDNFPIKQLLSLAGPNITDDTEGEIKVTLRLLFDIDITGIQFREIRIDWQPESVSNKYKLPGFDLDIKQVDFYSLIFGGKGKDNTWQGLKHIALVATLKQAASLVCTSSFAWERGDERELQNESAEADPLFNLSLTPPNNSISLLLLGFEFEQKGFPTLLHQLDVPLSALTNDNNCNASTLADDLLDLFNSWEVDFSASKEMTLPFLKSGGTEQFIQITEITKGEASDKKGVMNLKIELQVQIANTLTLNTSVNVALNLATFALKFDHSQGLTLSTKQLQLTGSFLGFKWLFKGVKQGDAYQYLTLATDEYNYRITLACDLELEYSLLGDDPIAFKVEDFQLSDAGVSFKAKVLERPARLNGLDTQFTFSGSIEVVDSISKGFTLKGTGAMPPDLLGEATVAIALQFEPEDNVIKLKSGCADLQGNKPLKCAATGFQFSVTAIGLEFIDDGAYHLYFTLTGTAELSAGAGDDGPLALLSGIGIELVDCPITGDPSVIAEHINFLIPLPNPVTFPMLGCFQMEVRGIAFVPKATIFDSEGTAAMHLSGKIGFADAGDADSDKINLHNLYIGLPKQGSFVPQISMDVLPLNINMGEAFKLNGTLKFLEPGNDSDKEGFEGEGVLKIQGLPETAASFSFVRIQQSDLSWVKAWFIYLEVRQVSFPIPAVQLYLREVGLGFGYRYTLASIKLADKEQDLGKLIKGLRTLSRTQGNLSKLDAWAPDADTPDPQWTIAMRGLFSQSSAAVSPLDWKEEQERKLKNAYLFDAVLALRSDFTFLMVVRAWLNTNYYDFYQNEDNKIKDNPLFSGFVLITPRQKRLLAQLASNPDGYMGSNPPLPPPVQKALQNSRFSATLLIEPRLVHYELGWPNQLQWGDQIGPLKAEFRGGYIMRISRKNLVMGNSVEVRAELDIGEKVDSGFLGVEFKVNAKVAYGARYIGVIPFTDSGSFAFYGAAGIEASIDLSFQAWMRFSVSVRLFGKKYTRRWTKTLRLAATVDLTAAIEIGITTGGAGVRGHGALALPVMGHRVRISIRIGVDEKFVNIAQEATKGFLHMGLEAKDVRAIPGTSQDTLNTSSDELPEQEPGEAAPIAALVAPPTEVVVDVPQDIAPMMLAAAEDDSQTEESEILTLSQPDYILFIIRKEDKYYVALLPKGEGEIGFLPPPPADKLNVEFDFQLEFGDTSGIKLQHWKPESGKWVEVPEPTVTTEYSWKAQWRAIIEAAENIDITDEAGQPVTEMIDADGNPVDENEQKQIPLDQYLLQTFDFDKQLNIKDPSTIQLDETNTIRDSRLDDPAESDYEAAVRGAEAQFIGSPFFRHDQDNEYDQKLIQAFANRSVTDDSKPTVESPVVGSVSPQAQQAEQLRGSIVQDIIADLKDYVTALSEVNDDQADIDFEFSQSLAFQMGLVFAITVEDQQSNWLKKFEDGDALIKIRQRVKQTSVTVDGESRSASLFNRKNAGFQVNPPHFVDAKSFASSGTIALAWKLKWEDGHQEHLSACQCDPEHHLQYYEMRRRVVRGPQYLLGKEQLLTRCPADTLLKGELKSEILKSRFALVDHFAEETPEQRAALPEEGITYYYSITPIDHEGQRGNPLTQVVTRFPDTPPLVPTDAVLTTHYDLTNKEVSFFSKKLDGVPSLLAVEQLVLDCTLPIPDLGRPAVSINKIYLLFRPLHTLPLGYYGQDSATADSGVKALPAANAVPLEKDIVVELRSTPCELRILAVNDEHSEEQLISQFKDEFKATECAVLIIANAKPATKWTIVGYDDTKQFRSITVDKPDEELYQELDKGGSNRFRIIELATTTIGRTLSKQPLRRGVPLNLPVILPPDKTELYPLGGSDWQPRAWRVFIQTEAAPRGRNSGVRSALVPVQLQLEVHRSKGAETYSTVRPVPELEWLPRHCRLAWLPAVDADEPKTGFVHVPMPTVGEDNAPIVKYQQHPEPRRGIRFYFNQGASSKIEQDVSTKTETPLSLVAGYQLLQLDIDAHTNETLASPDKTLKVLKPIRSIDLLPANDLYLTPGDTHNTEQWEAWYPSVVYRNALQTKSKSDAPIAWYSWRDSMFEWPVWNDTGAPSDAQHSPQRLHPLLRAVIDGLETVTEVVNDLEVDKYAVDLQSTPAIQPMDADAFFNSTAADSDPYGWGILQRFGLSMTLSIRTHPNRDNQLLTGEDLLKTVDNQLTELFETEAYEDLKKHLHVERLYQPSRSVDYKKQTVENDALLGIIQISLRPVINQYLHYGVMELTGPAGLKLLLIINEIANTTTTVTKSDSITLVVQNGRSSSEAGAQTSLSSEIEIREGETLEHNVRLPLNGKLKLIFRGSSEAIKNTRIKFAIPVLANKDCSQLDGEAIIKCEANRVVFNEYFERSGTDPSSAVMLKKSLPTIEKKRRQILNYLNSDSDRLVMEQFFELNLPEKIEVAKIVRSDSLSTYFTAPIKQLENDFADLDSTLGKQWKLFKEYAEELNRNNDIEQSSGEDPEKNIVIPDNKDDIEKFLPKFLIWSQRFFEHSGNPGIEPSNTGWLAVAYPVNTNPAYATPDASGRLCYDHINKDRWGHIFRYYLKPSGRYELLWRSLLAELKLSVDLPSGMPKLESGGIDVVLERTHPISLPLILSSRRLDPPISSGNKVPLGKTWEVMIARHPEQQLDSSNLTLRHRLAYQQQPYTLIREFAESKWADNFIKVLAQAENNTEPSEGVENNTTSQEEVITATPIQENILILDSKSQVPVQAEHYSTSELMQCSAENSQLELAISTRLPSFHQGALVLQWQGLPHFYNVHLTVFAQAASVCSPTTTMIQKAFEYRSPPARLESVADSEHLSDSTHMVRVRLERLWESQINPEAAKLQWEVDAPIVNEKPTAAGLEVYVSESAFPDPLVIYQVIHEFSGNIEVQLEISANPSKGTFELRQFGSQYKKPETVKLLRESTHFWLEFELKPVSEQSDELDLRRQKPKIRTRRGSAPISDTAEIDASKSSEQSPNGEQE